MGVWECDYLYIVTIVYICHVCIILTYAYIIVIYLCDRMPCAGGGGYHSGGGDFAAPMVSIHVKFQCPSVGCAVLWCALMW